MNEIPEAHHFIWNIDPQVFSFSPVPRWYGLIFAIGIIGGYSLMKRMILSEGKDQSKDRSAVDRLLLYVFAGMMIGMRLGHCLFYEPQVYLPDPIRIFKIWEGGYASHGGFAGLIVALILFARRYPTFDMWWLLDRMTIPSMFAAGCIRVGNFFNSEMIGHPSEVPWAIIFKHIDNQARHPAQLYEAVGFFSIFALTMGLYQIERLRNRRGFFIGLVLVLGFSWRFFVEFFKENQVAFEAGLSLNMGQLLSIPFILAGIVILASGSRLGTHPSSNQKKNTSGANAEGAAS